jgi:two-component system OmpR family sensor kinase
MKPIRTSLYWRLLVGFCVANLLVLVLGGLFARRFVEFTTSIEINWAALAQDADQAYESGGRDALAAWVAQQRQQGVEATLFEHGEMLHPIRLGASVRSQLPALLSCDRSVVMQPRPSFYLAFQQVVGDDGNARQLLAMSRSHTRLRPQTREKIYLAMQLLLSLVFIGLVGWWVARSVARPVEALRHATRRMAEGELSARVGRQGGMAHDELAQLAGDFDVMAGRIEALVAHDRGVLQDLSHELRSPLARLQLILDLARRSDPAEAAPYFQQAEQEIGRLDRMLGEMLALSRMEGGLPGMDSEQVELAEVVRDCLEQSRLDAGAQQVQLQLASVDSAVVSGNRLLLERALDNLLTNAIKFSPVGGTVEMDLRINDQQVAEISVRDHGPGVPEQELAQLFRPFFRGSNAARAEGHGLGLAIVQRVVQVHGGRIEVSNAQGDGLEVRMWLPLA